MPCLFRTAAFIAVALLLGARAEAGTFGLHVGSEHFPQKGYNNFNPGLYYRTDAGWTAGAYRNSLRNMSVYAGYTWKLGPVDVTTGGVTGYFQTLQALVVPSVTLFTYQGLTPRLAYIPKVEKKVGAHVLHLMLDF